MPPFKVARKRSFRKGGGFTYIAAPCRTGRTNFNLLCDRLSSTCTASTGDVKLVVEQLIETICDELQNGRTVELGELGSFRLSFGSICHITPDQVDAQSIRNKRVVFLPGKRVKEKIETIHTWWKNGGRRK